MYEARKSGYRVEVIEQGFWNRDSQIVYQSQTLMQICPLAQGQGNPVRLSSQFDWDSQTEILTDEAGRSQPIDWRNAEAILQQTLTQAGFRSLDPLELRGMVRMIGWQGRDPGSAVAAVTIVREDYDGKYEFDRTRPITKWIAPAEIPPCSNPASQN
jgi:hypothetical protein